MPPQPKKHPEGRLDNYDDEVQCFGVGLDGKRCTNKTGHASGLCPGCRNDFEQMEGISLLRCSQCPLSNCPKRDTAPDNLCYFELYDEVVRFETKEKVQTVMRRVLKSKYQIFKRLERLLTPNEIRDPESNLLRFYQQLGGGLFHDLIDYGRFMGYDVPQRQVKLEAKRVEFLDSALKGDGAKDEEQRIQDALKASKKFMEVEVDKEKKKLQEEFDEAD